MRGACGSARILVRELLTILDEGGARTADLVLFNRLYVLFEKLPHRLCMGLVSGPL